MSLRRLCTLVGLCAVLWTSGCCCDHGICRHRERDCGCACPCECSCYGPAEMHAAPPLAPVVVPAPLVMPGGGR